ncbi:hypothetical protein HPP92_027538 [Vanilla planifolia]|uniref:Peptidase S8/S53 domain-containing protein n=1 Tax=Vanilla planifolia TaxID=51239 RepID=A0A835U7K9_VANPL|nr:hypothetical protein HPP92_027538 [Vanilla planifolia]
MKEFGHGNIAREYKNTKSRRWYPELRPPQPRNTEGHGTYTLSTNGGSLVPWANVLGFGIGTAKVGSPRARVATYKICWTYKDSEGCLDADILAAFDAAIHDGVYVLSVSLGGDPTDYLEDRIAIGAFHVISKGISVVKSVGNSGPKLGKVENVALWLLIVGARTIDREFPAIAIFGEHRLKGESLSDASLPRNKLLPVIHSHDAAAASVSLDFYWSPKGTISYPFTMLGTKPTPSMALFLSRGSNTFPFEILKLYCPSPQDSSSIVLFPKAQPTSTYSQSSTCSSLACRDLRANSSRGPDSGRWIRRAMCLNR